MSETRTLGQIAEEEHEHSDLPPDRLRNGCWKCIGCGQIVSKRSRWLNWCTDCGYDWYER